MTLGGWLVMILSVGTVSTLFGWCIYQVLTEKKVEDHHIHGLDIDTPDQPTSHMFSSDSDKTD